MKKTLLLFAAAALFSIASTTQAQDEQCFKKGTSAINLGVGIGNTVSYNSGNALVYGGYGVVGHAAFTPAFTASYEYGIIHVGIGIIGAGLQFGFQGTHNTYNDGYYYTEKEKWTTLSFSPRATYHFDFLNKKKFDIYPIIQININSYGYSDTYTATGAPGYTYYPANSSSNSIGVRPSILVAARYFFTPNIGVYSELGYDISIIKAGLSIKFGGK